MSTLDELANFWSKLSEKEKLAVKEAWADNLKEIFKHYDPKSVKAFQDAYEKSKPKGPVAYFTKYEKPKI